MLSPRHKSKKFFNFPKSSCGNNFHNGQLLWMILKNAFRKKAFWLNEREYFLPLRSLLFYYGCMNDGSTKLMLEIVLLRCHVAGVDFLASSSCCGKKRYENWHYCQMVSTNDSENSGKSSRARNGFNATVWANNDWLNAQKVKEELANIPSLRRKHKSKCFEPIEANGSPTRACWV